MTFAHKQRAFTLIEMLTVMAVIAILAGVVLSIYNLAQTKAGRARAESEIKALTLGIENYKADNGTVPRSLQSDALDPTVSGSPTGYAAVSQFLYISLSGDTDPTGAPDFKIGPNDSKSYLSEFFKPQNLNCQKDANGNILRVNYIQDPFGNCYGYSTLGAKTEETFENQVRASTTPGSIKRPATKAGFNTTYDLWSTGGLLNFTSKPDLDRAKWIKNW